MLSFNEYKTLVLAAAGTRNPNRDALKARGYRENLTSPYPAARAGAISALFTGVRKHIYEGDLIVGSIRGMADESVTDAERDEASALVRSFGVNSFQTNSDHFGPDYWTLLERGVPGLLASIDESKVAHAGDDKAQRFLDGAKIAMTGFRDYIVGWADAADAIGNGEAAETCRAIASRAPETFREALQLVWLTHVAFVLEGRYAMAFGRLDQYLWRFYARDRFEGRITRAEALEMVRRALMKIGESNLFGGDDVVNIAISGTRPDGACALNELSYIILEAVGDCDIPGPNLSARMTGDTPDDFYDACLRVIGTGLGYPALMNDGANIPALMRHGYALEDARDYCMVGCIENFIQGKQPAWSDGRYNTPKYIELAINDGVDMLTGLRAGPATGCAESFASMDDFLAALRKQMEYGADLYAAVFRNENGRYDREQYTEPFMSCFCRDCIARGRDINDGGALYPSVHGAACMGIGTFADSLAAIEQTAFVKRTHTLAELRGAMESDFAGNERLRAELSREPKYGNDDDCADKYAVLYVDWCEDIFSRYHTRDGGDYYIGIAANTQNVSAGKLVAATPDGRAAREPLSDAASPTYGRDKKGPTSVMLSCSKPDYTRVACGTVLNQKYSPSAFESAERRAKLIALLRTYFDRGGQEVQINSVGRAMLEDAIEHPENYRSLVVRVSGFSAYYTRLDIAVQHDILSRTEHN